MTKLSTQVREFMLAFNQPIRTSPGVPDDAIVRLRARLIAEEAFEAISALFDGHTADRLADIYMQTMKAIGDGAIDVNLPAFIDGLADLDYVSEGGRLTFGTDGEVVADEVHDANMRKVGGYLDEHGKWRKPPGWKAPDIEGCLRAQGWGLR